MGFRNGAYATVWEVKEGKGNYLDVRLSTSKKNKTTEQYETDFSGFVRFIGDAAKDGTKLKEKDRIKIRECEVTNHYDKEKKVTYTNFAVFSFEENSDNKPASTDTSFMNVPDSDNEAPLPFD